MTLAVDGMLNTKLTHSILSFKISVDPDLMKPADQDPMFFHPHDNKDKPAHQDWLKIKNSYSIHSSKRTQCPLLKTCGHIKLYMVKPLL